MCGVKDSRNLSALTSVWFYSSYGATGLLAFMLLCHTVGFFKIFFSSLCIMHVYILFAMDLCVSLKSESKHPQQHVGRCSSF